MSDAVFGSGVEAVVSETVNCSSPPVENNVPIEKSQWS
jgi:hypothetical protein